jgi:predicted nucleic acid-binding protein
VLVYSRGERHPLLEPCVALFEAIAGGAVEATTTPEVIQEFVHVRARRRTRRDAVALGRSFADLLSPLLIVDEEQLRSGLRLFDRHTALGAFDAVLAAAAIAAGADALVSADRNFADVTAINHVAPGTPPFDRLLAG